MGEDRVQHHLLGRDQLIHIGLGVVVEHGGRLCVPHAALRRLDIGLLLGNEERCQAVAQVVEAEALPLFKLHPRLDGRGPKIIGAEHDRSSIIWELVVGSPVQLPSRTLFGESAPLFKEK